MKEACKGCDISQMDKVCSILDLDETTEYQLKRSIKEYLVNVDMKKTNPEVMGEIWGLMAEVISNANPYKKIKAFYNQEVLRIIPEVKEIIQSSEDSFETALKIAISGNLIDFAAKHEFDISTLNNKIHEVTTSKLGIDDSKELFIELQKVNTLLYLGDNCGEIVLDKMFIEEIKSHNANLNVYYGVRGVPIVNDVTVEDALMVGMKEVATVITNGDGALGTVLENTSEEFKDIFSKADIIICKGQGNYESLLENEKEQMYFLFMAKCEIVSEPLEIPLMSIVCMRNRIDLKNRKLESFKEQNHIITKEK